MAATEAHIEDSVVGGTGFEDGRFIVIFVTAWRNSREDNKVDRKRSTAMKPH